jgi:hypothetical protein
MISRHFITIIEGDDPSCNFTHFCHCSCQWEARLSGEDDAVDYAKNHLRIWGNPFSNMKIKRLEKKDVLQEQSQNRDYSQWRIE